MHEDINRIYIPYINARTLYIYASCIPLAKRRSLTIETFTHHHLPCACNFPFSHRHVTHRQRNDTRLTLHNVHAKYIPLSLSLFLGKSKRKFALTSPRKHHYRHHRVYARKKRRNSIGEIAAHIKH